MSSVEFAIKILFLLELLTIIRETSEGSYITLLWSPITQDELFIYRHIPIKLYELNIFSYYFLSSHYRYYTIVASNKSSTSPLLQRTYGYPRARVIFKSIKSSLCYPLSLGFFFWFFSQRILCCFGFYCVFFFNVNIVHVPLI